MMIHRPRRTGSGTTSAPTSQGKKTLRHIYLVDTLWIAFEEMAGDFDCSVDYLVNEALRLYARAQKREVGSPAPQLRQPRPTPRPPQPPVGSVEPARPPTPKPPTPKPAGPPPAVAPGPTLQLIFNGQRIPITKEQFVIGRSATGSDLCIKDGNISRKHAVVIRRGGAHYLKDLGSTNGIDFRGARIDNKRIDEGDTFIICDYQLVFTYR